MLYAYELKAQKIQRWIIMTSKTLVGRNFYILLKGKQLQLFAKLQAA